MALQSLHEESIHLGVKRLTELVKDRFYLPEMFLDMSQYVKNCGRCVARKILPQRVTTLNRITSTGPMELVCIDFSKDSKGVTNVLVVPTILPDMPKLILPKTRKVPL